MFKNCSCVFGWLCLSLLIVLLDQQSKFWVLKELFFHVTYTITTWIDFKLVYNSGAAFSFLSRESGWQRWFFIAIAVIMSAILLNWMHSKQAGSRLKSASAALLLGGAIGNLIDRLLRGYVVDFISIHYRSFYFPIFNVADISITVGAFLFICHSLWYAKKNP